MTIAKLCGLLGTLAGTAIAVLGIIEPNLTGAWRGMEVDPVAVSSGGAILTLGLALSWPGRNDPEPRPVLSEI